MKLHDGFVELSQSQLHRDDIVPLDQAIRRGIPRLDVSNGGLSEAPRSTRPKAGRSLWSL
jgi:hypothetical protein